MDEERRVQQLDAALERLVRGDAQPSLEDSFTEGILDVARSVRELGEPEWPADENAFLARLMPPPRRPRRASAWPWAAVAAAAGLALLLARVPGPLPSYTSSAAPALPSQSDAMRLSATFAPAAPANSPAEGAHASAATAHGRPATKPRHPPASEAFWLQGTLLVLRSPLATSGAYVTATDLTGRTVRIALLRRGAVEILDFSGLAPGWYRLPPGIGGMAILLPLPQGLAATGRLRFDVRDRATTAGKLQPLSLSLGARGVSLQVSIKDAAEAGAISLAGTAGVERPLSISVLPAGRGYRATLVFNPVLQGTRTLRFVTQSQSGPEPVLTMRLTP